MSVSRWVFTLLCVPLTATAANYSIPWFSVDAGGGRSAGVDANLFGVVGQSETGVSSGGGYTLSGGFLLRAVPPAEPGDCDNDGDIDLVDYIELQSVCFTGPIQHPGFPGLDPGCACVDLDMDGDVDLIDALFFQDFFTN